MKVYEPSAIRNVAVVGHGGCGKTSLVSAMLFDMGAVNRLGRVDDGTTVTDFDPDEIERKISLQTAVAYGEWRKAKLNLLDAPGYANFLSEARSALRVADAALVVVDSVAGVEVQTEKVWGYAADNDIPRLIVVNRMDRDRASFERTMQSLQRAFGRAVVPLAIPLGEEKGFEAVDVPAEIKETATSWREKLVEMVAESNEDLIEEFFDKGTLPQEDFVRGLRQAVLAGRLFPVLPASSMRNVGVHPLLDAIVELLPSPADRGEVEGTDPIKKQPATRRPAPDDPFSAFVFRTIADPHAGRISLFRVYSGTFKSDSTVHNSTRDIPERVGHLELLQGKTQTPVPELQAGDIGAVAKLKETQTGDTLCDKLHPIAYLPVVYPEPATTFAPAHGGGPGAEALARRADARDAPVRDGAAPHRGDRGAPAQALQGRGQPQEAPHPLP